MGEKLLKFYEEAQKIGGLKAKMRMAMLTNIPSSKAENEPDSLEHISKFENALKELRKEFK